MEWQYEWMEAFIKILGKEEMIFSDYETNTDKKEYSRVGDASTHVKWQFLIH